MQSYRGLFKMTFKGELQYRAKALSGITTQFFWGLLYIYLYTAFMKGNTVNGFSISQMCSFVWLGQAFFVLRYIEFRQCTKCHFDAPMGFIICYDDNQSFKGRDGREFGVLDASIITTYMMLKATELGLGTTWVGLFDAQKTKELFDLPDNIIPLAYLPTGYPKDGCEPNPRHFDNKSLCDTTEWL